MDILQTFNVELMSTNTKRFCSITNTCSNRTVYKQYLICFRSAIIDVFYLQFHRSVRYILKLVVEIRLQEIIKTTFGKNNYHFHM